MDKIRILLADDAREICDHFSEKISEAEGYEVVGKAYSGKESVAMVDELLPEVVLMDIQMETRTAGIDAIMKIHEKHPQIKCIALTIHENEELIFRAYLAGAVDYIIKTSSVENILSSIDAVVRNKLLVRPEVAEKLIQEYENARQKERRVQDTLRVMLKINTTEYEILHMICNGYTYKEIARQRCVEDSTIRSQINHILKKFDKKRMKDVIAELEELKIFS